jgi:hypothetical protein
MPARDVFWLRKHGGDPAQLDLAGWHEVEEQHDGRVFARQRTLRVHASAKY